MLGICYGMQLLAHSLGGLVERAEVGEFGRSELHLRESGRLLRRPAARADLLDVAPRHASSSAPPRVHRARLLDRLAGRRLRGSGARRSTRIQFHPEVVHTPYGQQILTTFPRGHLRLRTAAGRRRRSSMSRSRGSARRSATGTVICGLSGGVDSSVAALLVHRAIGDQLTCVFVDHGLMRKGEGEQVIAAFRDTFKVPLVAVDAEAPLPRAPARRDRPRDQAQADRRRVHPRLRGGGGEARRTRATSFRARSTPT